MGSDAESKLSSALATALGEADDEKQVHVAVAVETSSVEAEGSLPRAERLRARQHLFDRSAQPVVDAITSLGGTIDTLGWSNGIVYATISKRAVADLAEIDLVRDIDIAAVVEQ